MTALKLKGTSQDAVRRRIGRKIDGQNGYDYRFGRCKDGFKFMEIGESGSNRFPENIRPL